MKTQPIEFATLDRLVKKLEVACAEEGINLKVNSASQYQLLGYTSLNVEVSKPAPEEA